LSNSDEDLVVNTGATGANGALLVKKWGTDPKMAESKNSFLSEEPMDRTERIPAGWPH
jgi:hypothetical protein